MIRDLLVAHGQNYKSRSTRLLNSLLLLHLSYSQNHFTGGIFTVGIFWQYIIVGTAQRFFLLYEKSRFNFWQFWANSLTFLVYVLLIGIVASGRLKPLWWLDNSSANKNCSNSLLVDGKVLVTVQLDQNVLYTFSSPLIYLNMIDLQLTECESNAWLGENIREANEHI